MAYGDHRSGQKGMSAGQVSSGPSNSSSSNNNNNNNGGGGNNNVSPGQSNAMLGNTALAGLSQEAANTALGDIARAGYLGFGEDNEPVLDGDGNPVTTPGALQNVMDSINNQTDITESPGFMENMGNALSSMNPASLGLGIMGALAGIPGLGFVASMFGQDEESPNVVGTTENTVPANTTTQIGNTFTMPSYDPSFTEKVSRLFSPDLNYGSFQVDTPVGIAQQTYGDPTGEASYNFGPQGDPQMTMQELGNMATTDFNTQMENAPQNPGFFGRIGRRFTNAGFDFGEPNNNIGMGQGPDNQKPIIIDDPTITPLPIENNPLTGYGSIDPNANYQYLFGGRRLANGGLIPPESGPMSSGIGNLFKMK
tara:strand:- start:24 stop:1124 length:1101 start_codon:yes stop_codon:yes gene_type:complete